MKLNASTLLFFLVSTGLAALAVLAALRPDLVAPELVRAKLWLALGAWGTLSLGVLIRAS